MRSGRGGRPATRLGIVTNGPVGIQAAKVDTLGVEPLVDTVVYAWTCGLGGGKPSRTILDHDQPVALTRLGDQMRQTAFQQRTPVPRHHDGPDRTRHAAILAMAGASDFSTRLSARPTAWSML